MEMFRAYRRGKGILIKGQVARPTANAVPSLVKIPEPRTDTRTFRLDWSEHGTSFTGYAPVDVEHFEEYVPDFVMTLKIKLSFDVEIVIRRTRPPG